ncbi:hypothetical protein F751_6693 [Auxenochlorella protothecoides]|uniref:Uncharacterized protein n=1 Tax=Auxenochlorella protothecoides TaxID=3075 RepID=A0A087SQL4_AUXPR|nr:hypothetical protein F751_6693 [Auxenochlorella protothecoides]KFM28018.1 hypothetical protein F751_6693 [Auxenochlorella protothecoides]
MCGDLTESFSHSPLLLVALCRSRMPACTHPRPGRHATSLWHAGSGVCTCKDFSPGMQTWCQVGAQRRVASPPNKRSPRACQRKMREPARHSEAATASAAYQPASTPAPPAPSNSTPVAATPITPASVPAVLLMPLGAACKGR